VNNFNFQPYLDITDETELNEALEQFIKQQKHIHKILLHTNKVKKKLIKW
jgi:hypothetical protein